MLDLRITNTMNPSKYKQSVRFPNLADVVGPNAYAVDMIVTDTGIALFDITKIIYAINGYENGTRGYSQGIVQRIIRATGAWGWGTVVIFKRGGIFADVQAAKYLVGRFFAAGSGESQIRKIAHFSEYKAITNCPVDKYTGLPVDDASRMPTSGLLAIVPSTLVVNRAGVAGAPATSAKTAEENPDAGQTAIAPVSTEVADECVESRSPTDVAEKTEKASDKTPVGVAVPPTESVAGAVMQLIGILAAGKKLTFTISID